VAAAFQAPTYKPAPQHAFEHSEVGLRQPLQVFADQACLAVSRPTRNVFGAVINLFTALPSEHRPRAVATIGRPVGMPAVIPVIDFARFLVRPAPAPRGKPAPMPLADQIHECSGWTPAHSWANIFAESAQRAHNVTSSKDQAQTVAIRTDAAHLPLRSSTRTGQDTALALNRLIHDRRWS